MPSKPSLPVAMTVVQHIESEHGGSRAAFAAALDVAPQQVTKWIKMECIVVDGVLYSPRRSLSKPNV